VTLSVRDRRGAAVVVAIILLVTCVSVFGYRAIAHIHRIADLSRDLARIEQLNHRDRAMAAQLRIARANLKAQFLSMMDTSAFNVGNASAVASLMSNRIDRLGKHVSDVDTVVLKARSLADGRDSAHIRRDTSIALNRRIRVSELVTGMKAAFADFRANPYAVSASGTSASELGRQLGHAAYALSKSLRVIADDCGRAVERRNSAASSIRRDVLRLQRAGPFSV
jgi:outer membrane murein-binding lipoprotein Lpp